MTLKASRPVHHRPLHGRFAVVFLSLLVHCGQDEAVGECSIVDFAPALKGSAPHCVEVPVSTLRDGRSACRAFAASSRAECDCRAAGRKLPRRGECRLELQAPDDIASYSCLCELTQLEGDALARCLNDDDDTSDGWCYAARSPEYGPAADDAVTAACESGQRFKLQGGAALGADETLLLDCQALAGE